MADAAALLHGERGFLQSVENAGHRIVDAPMTKQLNSVTVRPVPAPERMRPAGR